jgi:hypothetical protein
VHDSASIRDRIPDNKDELKVFKASRERIEWNDYLERYL